MAVTEDGLTAKAAAFSSQDPAEKLITLYLQQEVMLGILTELQSTLARYRPLLDRYETAAAAGGFLAQRRALRNG